CWSAGGEPACSEACTAVDRRAPGRWVAPSADPCIPGDLDEFGLGRRDVLLAGEGVQRVDEVGHPALLRRRPVDHARQQLAAGEVGDRRLLVVVVQALVQVVARRDGGGAIAPAPGPDVVVGEGERAPPTPRATRTPPRAVAETPSAAAPARKARRRS